MSGYRRPRVSGGESPVRLELCGVPGGLPCGDLPGKDVDVGQASCKALSGQRRELDLDHVEPTRVYRCVMELQATRNAPCLLRGITLVERPERVDVQVVQHDADLLSVRIQLLDQLSKTLGDIQLGALLGEPDVSPSPVRLEECKQVARSVALVFVVDARRASRFDGKRRSRMVEELVGPFVEADGGIQRIVRLFIQVQDVFHVVDELGVYLGTHLKIGTGT